MAIRSNGKIIVVGGISQSALNVVDRDFAIVCYRLDGTVDSSFGINGASIPCSR